MNRKDHIDLFGATVLVVFSALLGLNQVMVKMVNAGMNPVFQAGFRSACAFAPVLLYALLMGKRLSISNGSLLAGIGSGLFFTAEFLLLFQALDYTSVARASIFFYTMPFWASIGAHFLIPGDRLSLVRVVGLALAIMGVVVAFAHDPAPATENALIGDILCLVAAVFWAGILILARTTPLQKCSPEMQLLYQLAVSALILVPFAMLSGETFREMTPLLWGVFLVQVLVVVSIGFIVWFWVLSIYPPASMASFSFLAPVFGVAFGWLILGEAISMNIVAALALVSLGIVLINRKKPAPSPG